MIPLIQGDTMVPGEYLNFVPLPVVETVSDAHYICRGVDINSTCTAAGPIEEHAPRSAENVARPGAGLTTEGQELLLALKRFAISLVRSRDSQHEEAEFSIKFG